MSDPLPFTTRIKSHADADRLSDAAFLAYVLAQGAKLILSLLARRWPEVK